MTSSVNQKTLALSAHYDLAMLSRSVVISLIVFLFLFAPAESNAKVLGRGQTVTERPVTVVAVTSAYKPSRVAIDVIPQPSALVRVEWMILCSDGPGPTTGGTFTTDQPAHRRVQLPPRPRGVCHLEAEATFVDPDQDGGIRVMFRGRAEKPPIKIP